MAERSTAPDDFDAQLIAQMKSVRVIRKRLLRRGHGELDDFVQEVVLRACANRLSLRDATRLGAWVAVIARNTARNWAKRTRPIPVEFLSTLPDPTASPIDDITSDEGAAALLDALNATDRELLLAHYVDEVDYVELQTTHGLSYAAVTSRMPRPGASSATARGTCGRPGR